MDTGFFCLTWALGQDWSHSLQIEVRYEVDLSLRLKSPWNDLETVLLMGAPAVRNSLCRLAQAQVASTRCKEEGNLAIISHSYFILGRAIQEAKPTSKTARPLNMCASVARSTEHLGMFLSLGSRNFCPAKYISLYHQEQILWRSRVCPLCVSLSETS